MTRCRAIRPIRRSARCGFTLVELLVAISIIAILMALILPAVMSARAASRRTQCQNNLRNIGLAMTNVAESARRFPASGNWGHHTQNDYNPYHSWVVDLLPWVDRQDVFNKWNFDQSSLGADNQALGNLHVAVLTCPSDITLLGRGDLSYVVNGGFGFTIAYNGVGNCPVNAESQPIDFNGNGVICPADQKQDGTPLDQQLFFQTGMFFAQNWRPTPAARFHTFNDIQDGLSQTILLTENVRTGADRFAPGINWASPVAFRTSFFLLSAVCLDNACTAGNVDYAHANQGRQAINAGLEQAEGEAPWPSSYHTGGVFVVFGDGHVKFLSQNVAGAVYAALVSPQGGRITGPLAQNLLSADEY
ncbi:MAG: DUF1559 domain-containing protein [Planctomycetaceae bacterium]|nr:DUF1559 domain-containing protein [Planctomycetaceae bacterium]